MTVRKTWITIAASFVLLISYGFASSKLCNQCMRSVDVIVPGGSVRDSLVAFYLTKACRLSGDEPRCIQYLEEHQNDLPTWKKEGILSKKVCEGAGACVGSEECAKCLGALHDVNRLIPHDIDPAQFEPMVIAVCQKYHKMFGITSKQCKKLAHLLATEFINVLGTEDFEEKTCMYLDLCD
ncbi:hypothetical protein P9112_009718 [Eukaryota sp. TZLM1-RC]